MISRALLLCCAFTLAAQGGTAHPQSQSPGPISTVVSDWSQEEGVAIASNAHAQIVQEIEKGFLSLKGAGSYSNDALRGAVPAATQKYLSLLVREGEAPQFDALLVEEISPGGAFFLWPTRWPVVEIRTGTQNPEILINGEALTLSPSQRQKRPLTILGTVGKLIVELRESAALVCKEEFDAEEGERYSMVC
jgi:hypothetical protein